MFFRSKGPRGEIEELFEAALMRWRHAGMADSFVIPELAP